MSLYFMLENFELMIIKITFLIFEKNCGKYFIEKEGDINDSRRI